MIVVFCLFEMRHYKPARAYQTQQTTVYGAVIGANWLCCEWWQVCRWATTVYGGGAGSVDMPLEGTAIGEWARGVWMWNGFIIFSYFGVRWLSCVIWKWHSLLIYIIVTERAQEIRKCIYFHVKCHTSQHNIHHMHACMSLTDAAIRIFLRIVRFEWSCTWRHMHEFNIWPTHTHVNTPKNTDIFLHTWISYARATVASIQTFITNVEERFLRVGWGGVLWRVVGVVWVSYHIQPCDAYIQKTWKYCWINERCMINENRVRYCAHQLDVFFLTTCNTDYFHPIIDSVISFLSPPNSTILGIHERVWDLGWIYERSTKTGLEIVMIIWICFFNNS